jgi:chorismate mutase
MNPARPVAKPPRTYSKHGLTVLKRAVNGLGGRTIDMRTTLGKALAQWRADLVADLGGRDAISTQQAAVIDLAVKTKLLLDSIDAWLLTQPGSLVDRRRRALIPVVRERQQLADAIARYMMTLGLERRKPPAQSLDDVLREIEREKATAGAQDATGGPTAADPPSPPSLPGESATAAPRGPEAAQ